MNRVSVHYKNPPPPANPDHVDKIGRYPANVHVPALESRRYLWTSRAYAVTLYASLAFSIVLAAMLFFMVTLRGAQPSLVYFPPHDRFATSPPAPGIVTRSGLSILAEKMVGEYVQLREEITPDNPVLMEQYTQFIQARSTDEIFAFFQNPRQAMIENYRIRRFQRRVDITRIGFLGESYLINYTTTDLDVAGRAVQKLAWQAIIKADWNVMPTTNPEWAKANPLGFGVTAYQTRVVEILSGQ